MSATWFRVVAVAGLLVGGVACGGDDVVIPTAEQLADRLIDVGTYEGDWTVFIPDGAPAGAANGVVTDEMVETLPRMELCDAASDEARALAEGIRWMAFRQIDLAVDDPLDPPDDLTGHLVSAQEFLMSGEPDEIQKTFDVFRDGMRTCLGVIEPDMEGPGFAEEMDVPQVGDDRYGVLITIEEAGGVGEWRIHSVLVRRGAVLASVVIVDIRANAEPYYTFDQVGRMIETAVDRL